MPSTLPATLTLPPETIRSLGGAVVERVAVLPDAPVGEPATRAQMEARLREPLPEHPSDPHDVLERVLSDVLAPGLRVDHPRFFAFTPVPGNPVGVLADALAAGFGVFAGAWCASPGAAMIELVVLDWLRSLCGLPASTEGLFVGGGSMANLTALAVALQERAGSERSRATVYLSDEAHSSVRRAVDVVGVSARHVRVLATDADQRLVPGAVDPLVELRRVCDGQGIWLHVDGAYGATAMLCDQGRAALHALELTDSLTLDPHKWLFPPVEAGCLLVRDGAALERTFRVAPAYLRDAAPGAAEVNFADRGPQLTRGFRALKLWMSLKVFGAAQFRAAIEHGLALAEHAENVLAHDAGWEVVTPARLGIVTFRPHAAGASAAELDAICTAMPAAALADGLAFLSTHQVHGRPALRLCTINPRTTRADVDRTIDRLAALAEGANAHDRIA